MVSWLETLKAKSQKVRKIGKRTQNIGKIGKIRGFVITERNWFRRDSIPRPSEKKSIVYSKL